MPTIQFGKQPDEIKDPTNLYSELTSGKRFGILMPMLDKTEDGKELHLVMTVLNCRETNQVEVSAYNDTLSQFKVIPKKDEPGYETWMKLLDDNRAYWTIQQACRLPTDLNKTYFIDARQVADTYSAEQAAILCTNYLIVKSRQPHLKHYNPDDPNALQAVLEVIKRDGADSAFFLSGFTSLSLNLLIKSLAEKLLSLPTENGSSGMPSDNTETTETTPKPKENESNE